MRVCGFRTVGLGCRVEGFRDLKPWRTLTFNGQGLALPSALETVALRP